MHSTHPEKAYEIPQAQPNQDVEDDLEQVRAHMLKLASGERFERLGAIVQEHLLTGGKRLRARLALTACAALEVDRDAAIGWAAACELLHNATLIHDDLQDRDELRRGKYSVWVRHGEAQAINAGDLLLMLPFIALEGLAADGALRWELSRAIARRAEETVRGQSLEMTLLSSCRWNWGAYTQAAVGKTSALMTLPVHGAALLGGRVGSEAETLSNCFRNLGLLFQLQDDVVDLYRDKGRRQRGGDIREGRVSALVVEHLERHPADLSWLGPLLGKTRQETTEADVERVAHRFKAGGALAGVLQRIEQCRHEVVSSERLRAEPRLHRVAEDLIERSLGAIADLD